MKKVPKKVAALLQQSTEAVPRGEDVNVPLLVHRLGTMIDEARKQVAATAVELEAGGRRAVEHVGRVIDRVRVRQFIHRLHHEDRRHLRLELIGDQHVDVVIAVVDDSKFAVSHISLEVTEIQRV